MIVEERIYDLKIGAVPDYFRLYEANGRAAQTRILGHMLGYYSTDIGRQHQVIHMWAYADHADRDRRRAELVQDPEFRVFMRETAPLILAQENRILKPAPFSPCVAAFKGG